LLSRQSAEISPFIVGIPERVDNCGGGDAEDRPGGCIELEFRDTVDYQIIGHGLEGGSRNCIAEDIVRPGQHGFGRYRNMTRYQAQIAAFTRSKH
jgi:hypothetical protein